MAQPAADLDGLALSRATPSSSTTSPATATTSGGNRDETGSTASPAANSLNDESKKNKNATPCTIPKTELTRKLTELNPSSAEFHSMFRRDGNKVVCAICGHLPFKHPQGSTSRRTLSNNLRSVAGNNSNLATTATTTTTAGTPTSAPVAAPSSGLQTPNSLPLGTPPPTAYGNNSEDAARDWERRAAAEKEREKEEEEFRSRNSIDQQQQQEQEEPQIPEYNSSNNLVISPRPMQPPQQHYGSQSNLNNSQIFRQASTNSSIFGGGGTMGNSFPSRGATPHGGGGTFPRVESGSLDVSPGQQSVYQSAGSLPGSASNRNNSRGDASAMPSGTTMMMTETPRSGLGASRSPPRPQSISGSQDGQYQLTREITRQYTSDIATAPHMAGSIVSPTTGGGNQYSASNRGSAGPSPRPQSATGDASGLPPLPHSDSNRTGSAPNSAPKRVMRPPTLSPAQEITVQDEGRTRGAHLERPHDPVGDSPNSPALPTFPSPAAAVAAAGGRSEAPQPSRDPILGQQYCPDQHRVPPTGMNVERDRSFDPLPAPFSRFKKTTRAPLTWKKARRQRCAAFSLLLFGFVIVWSCIVFIPWLMLANKEEVSQASEQITGTSAFRSNRYPMLGIAIGAATLSLFINIFGARLTETGQFILYAANSIRPYDLTNAVKARGPKLFWTPLPLNPWTNEAYSPLVAANTPGRLGGQLRGDTKGIPAGQLSMPMRNLKEVYPEVNRRDQLINDRYQRLPSPTASFPEFPTYHVWDDQSTGFVEVTDGTDFSDKLGFRVSICRELCFADDVTKMLYESEFSAYYRQVAARAPPLKNVPRSRSRSVTPRAAAPDAQTHLLGGDISGSYSQHHQQYSIQGNSNGNISHHHSNGSPALDDDDDSRELVEEDYSLEGISDQTIWGWLDDANKGGFLLSELGMYLFAILGLFPLIIYFKSHRIGAATLMSRKVIKKIVPR